LAAQKSPKPRPKQLFQRGGDHYREQAENCRLEAEKSKYDDHKISWLKLAAQWQRLAEEAGSRRQQAEQSQPKEKP
jgi:hypothetical protein